MAKMICARCNRPISRKDKDAGRYSRSRFTLNYYCMRDTCFIEFAKAKEKKESKEKKEIKER